MGHSDSHGNSAAPSPQQNIRLTGLVLAGNLPHLSPMVLRSVQVPQVCLPVVSVPALVDVWTQVESWSAFGGFQAHHDSMFFLSEDMGLVLIAR